MGAGVRKKNGGKEESKPRLTLKQHMFRRSIHLATALIFLYYIFPEPFFFIPRKVWVFFLFGILPYVIERYRMKRKILLFGQRPHESQKAGSYLWALWASLIMILVLPQSIVVPVILIFSVADPILGEIRYWKKWMVFPLGGLILTLMFMVFGYGPELAFIGGFSMVIGESIEAVGELRIRPELIHLYTRRIEGLEKLRVFFKTDDDFSTQFVPGMVLGFVYIYWPSLFPGPYFSSIPI